MTVQSTTDAGGAPTHRKFAFDTVFGEGGGVVFAPPPKPKRTYTPEDVEALQAQAYDEGRRAATVLAEQAAAAALADVAATTRAALAALTTLAHDHRSACAELALATGRAIAGAALTLFPDAPAAAALEALGREVEATPRLAVRVSPDLVDRFQVTLAEAAQRCGYPGQILVRGDADLPAAAFVFDWGEGRASFDPLAAAGRVTAALQTALAAEGLHAEPLPLAHTSAGES